jgi:hypothetical protein
MTNMGMGKGWKINPASGMVQDKASAIGAEFRSVVRKCTQRDCFAQEIFTIVRGAAMLGGNE